MTNIRTDAGMRTTIRYRLIQILEIVLWLGGAAGIGVVAQRVWLRRESGFESMMLVIGPGIFAIGTVLVFAVVLIGIYHNTRRSADAIERLAKQGAGTLRRLPGAARGDVPVAAVPTPAPAPVVPVPATPAPAVIHAAPPPSPEVPQPAPASDSVAGTTAPEPALKPAVGHGPAPILRGNARRLGPAS